MKTLILTTALVVAATFSFAQKPAENCKSADYVKKSDIEVALLQPTENEITLLMEKEPKELVKIKVYEDNKLLYVGRVKKAGTAHIQYDISAFPDGNYVFEVVKEKEVVMSTTIKKGATALADKN